MAASIRLLAAGFAEWTIILGALKLPVATASSIQNSTSHPVPHASPVIALVVIEQGLRDLSPEQTC